MKPRSHIRAVTSARRHASVDGFALVLGCGDDALCCMRRKEVIRELRTISFGVENMRWVLEGQVGEM